MVVGHNTAVQYCDRLHQGDKGRAGINEIPKRAEAETGRLLSAALNPVALKSLHLLNNR